jgi:hypothetical protein
MVLGHVRCCKGDDTANPHPQRQTPREPYPPPKPALLAPSITGSAFVDVITELGRLYREARRGEIEPCQATRLASILTGRRTALDAVEFERSTRLKRGLPLVSAQH